MRATIEVPEVPYPPEGEMFSVNAAYYREAARNIRYAAVGGASVIGGSNLTETVAKACDAIADALEASGAITDESPVWELDLNTRMDNALSRAGVRTVGELTEMTAFDLLDIRNVGRGGVENVRATLALYGRALAGEKRHATVSETNPSPDEEGKTR